MFEVTLNEFPFVADIPKREKSKLQTVWERFNELKRAQEEHGILVPCRMAAQLLDVSHQRVAQLLDAGKLERIQVGGLVFVTENSLLEWARAERSYGRPVGPKTIGDCVRAGVRAGVETYRDCKAPKK